jgi:hypothetical protein
MWFAEDFELGESQSSFLELKYKYKPIADGLHKCVHKNRLW